MKNELASVINATKRSCLDKCSNLCLIFSINPFICKCLGLAPRYKQWGPECWINDCYLLCGLLISFVSVAPDCVTAECCDCVSFSAASALTPHHLFLSTLLALTVEREQLFKHPCLKSCIIKAWLPLMCWYEKSNVQKFPNFYLTTAENTLNDVMMTDMVTISS